RFRRQPHVHGASLHRRRRLDITCIAALTNLDNETGEEFMRTTTIVAIAAAAFLSDCGQSDSESNGVAAVAGRDRPITVGFSQVGSESGWRTSFSESVKAEAARRGIDLKFSDARQKQENQITAISSFIAQGVD